MIDLGAANAVLNGTCAVLLVSGRVAIARRAVNVHRAIMLTAFTVSCVFLASYVTRALTTGTRHDMHTGWVHALYLVILFTHMLLAMAVVPLVLRSLWLALRARRFDAHARWARVTFPVWLYVSVTGVIVYLMLYVV